MTSAPTISRTEALPIRFEHVSKTYPDGTVAIQSLDLECEAGRTSVFVGPSGCGKTTSLRMINRMVEPTGGRLCIGDDDVLAHDPVQLRRHIGYVIQNAGLFPHRTVADNITAVPRMLGMDKREARGLATELMRRVGLDASLAGKYPSRLSGGQQQRVGVARALAADPPVLLMDEPFSAVDPVVRAELQDELLRLQSQLGKTIVFVTHDMDEAIRLADKIVVFERGGHIAQQGTPESILLHPANDTVRDFLGGASGMRLLSILPATELLADTRALRTERIELVTDAAGRPVALRDRAGVEHPVDGALRASRATARGVLDALVVSDTDTAVLVDDEGRAVGVLELDDVFRAVEARKSTDV